MIYYINSHNKKELDVQGGPNQILNGATLAFPEVVMNRKTHVIYALKPSTLKNLQKRNNISNNKQLLVFLQRKYSKSLVGLVNDTLYIGKRELWMLEGIPVYV